MANTTAARTPAGVWTLARAIASWLPRKKKSYSIGGVVPACPLPEPTHWHATPAMITIEGRDVYAEWDTIESPDVLEEWTSWEPWFPRSYSLN